MGIFDRGRFVNPTHHFFCNHFKGEIPGSNILHKFDKIVELSEGEDNERQTSYQNPVDTKLLYQFSLMQSNQSRNTDVSQPAQHWLLREHPSHVNDDVIEIKPNVVRQCN